MPDNRTSTAAIQTALQASLNAADARTTPYPHWLLTTIANLPFAAPSIQQFAGRREANNPTRRYFNPAAQARHPIIDSIT
jgi:hypothetical protein